MLRVWTLALGFTVIGALVPGTAKADCGVAPAALRPASDSESSAAIVGMWKVTFIAEGNVGPGMPPDGTVIDSAFSQWHADGTEIMNSSRNPATQSFCLGVWEGGGSGPYKLNHFAISWDPPVDTDHPLGIANIRERVMLHRDGRLFSGTFTIDQYDRAGNLLVHLTGRVEGMRIRVDTPISAVL